MASKNANTGSKDVGHWNCYYEPLYFLNGLFRFCWILVARVKRYHWKSLVTGSKFVIHDLSLPSSPQTAHLKGRCIHVIQTSIGVATLMHMHTMCKFMVHCLLLCYRYGGFRGFGAAMLHMQKHSA